METIAVIDFETTGMSPRMGARATEIAVVQLQGGRVVDRYQSLMHTGAWVPPFIERLTGISNRMLDGAPPAEQVMREAAAFVGDAPLVAHNAAFDRGFWLAELARAHGEAAGGAVGPLCLHLAAVAPPQRRSAQPPARHAGPALRLASQRPRPPRLG